MHLACAARNLRADDRQHATLNGRTPLPKSGRLCAATRLSLKVKRAASTTYSEGDLTLAVARRTAGFVVNSRSPIKNSNAFSFSRVT